MCFCSVSHSTSKLRSFNETNIASASIDDTSSICKSKIMYGICYMQFKQDNKDRCIFTRTGSCGRKTGAPKRWAWLSRSTMMWATCIDRACVRCVTYNDWSTRVTSVTLAPRRSTTTVSPNTRHDSLKTKKKMYKLLIRCIRCVLGVLIWFLFLSSQIAWKEKS